jgi:glucokinase
VTTLLDQTHLVGDVGGTYLRLGLVRAGECTLMSTAKMRCSDFPDVAGAVQSYLASFPEDRRPVQACIAVAGPVEGDDIRLTNNPSFSFSVKQLRDALRLEELLIVNDVAAVARGVADLLPRQYTALTEHNLDLTRTVAVVAPGTGLGVAALIPTPSGPLVLPGEGGHIPLPVTAASTALAQQLSRAGAHLSTEDLVSGGGLPRLDSALRRLRGEAALARTAAEITSSGETGPGQVLDVFVELLAGAAQTYALTLGARGGVVLGGGFLRDLTDVLRQCRFVERFREHPKVPDYLGAIPVVADLRAHPALVGAAGFLCDAA